MDREFDLIVWGASGFTGRLVAEYLLERYGASGDLRWALAGRNRAKIEAVRRELGEPAAKLEILLADGDDTPSLERLVNRTRVVCTTVGPYAMYGSKLLAACACAGTDYCDLAGEAHWMRRMLDAHLEEAAASGARIVHSCGFDCIPSDLGVFLMQREMRSRHDVPCARIKFRVKGFSGAASGGTIASMTNMMDEAESDPEVNRVMNDPYALNPKDRRSGPDGQERVMPAYDLDFAEWTAPFMMAAINTKIVRRSNALLDYAYGPEFRYDEAMLMGSGPIGLAKAAGISASMGAILAAASLGPLRRAFSSRLPAPGDGPTREQRESGYFDIRLLGEHPDTPAKNLRARVTGDRDPGYGSTARMLAESAVCLAKDPRTVGGGIWTPAAAMGDPLLERLQQNAGLSFTIEA